jgi:hypothetical protein
MRFTTGVGIAVGGTGGALIALIGAGHPAPAPPARAAVTAVADSTHQRQGPAPVVLASASAPGSASAPVSASAAAPASASAPTALAAAPGGAPPSAAPVNSPPPLDSPTTREGLLKAELFCDQKRDFDECARAAQALETGSAGPADAAQAKRFRKIAITHLVDQCEAGSPHACYVLAAKYRAGSELTPSTISAEALEKRGLDLCRFRPAPECPPK